MKKQFQITIILMAIASLSYAQRLLPNTFIKGDKSTFKVDTSWSRNNFVVKNTNNVLCNRKPRLTALNDPAVLYNKLQKGSMRTAFKEVFSDARLKELSTGVRKSGVDVDLYVLPTGKIAEVDFVFYGNTNITATEIEQLENAIKKDVYFNITSAEAKDGDFYDIGIAMRYSNILNNIGD